MYSSNSRVSKKCTECKVIPPLDLVSHIVNCHPKIEVYTSRLSRKMLNLCENGVPTADRIETNNENDTFSGLCVFCEKDSKYALTKDQWCDHLASHTGEFRYECSDCGDRFANAEDHTKSIDFNCESNNRFEKPQFSYENDNLYAFVCELCNYTQFGQHNIVKHLRKNHDIEKKSVNEYFSKVTVLKFEGDVDNDDRATTTIDKNTEMITGKWSTKYRAFCRFCEKKHPKSKPQWIKHMIKFTKEANAFHCNVCKSLHNTHTSHVAAPKLRSTFNLNS